MRGYKLMRVRKDGTLGPLFINKTQVVPINEWLRAECHPTKGYAIRTGWHCLAQPLAPHLSKKGRVWCEVNLRNITPFARPVSQGGRWFLAKYMRVRRILYELS
jgi:hypothetical protein